MARPEDILKYQQSQQMSSPEFSSLVAQMSKMRGEEPQPYENLNTPPKNVAERFFTALDKPGSVARLGIENALGINKEQTTVGDVLLRDKEVNARTLLNNLGKEYGVDLELGGKKEGYHGYDRVGNFITELGVNIVTDPLTYAGVGLFDKAKNVAEGLGFSGDVAKNLARASIGAGIGFASSNEKDDTGSVLLHTAIGAGTLGLGGPALRQLGSALGKVGGHLVDATQAGLHPEIFGHDAVQKTGMGYSKAYEIAQDAANKFGFVSREVQKLNKNVLENMTPEQMEVVSGFVDGKHTLFHQYRNELELQTMANEAISKSGSDKYNAVMSRLDELISTKGQSLGATEIDQAKKQALVKLGARRIDADGLDRLTKVVNNRVWKEAEVDLAKINNPELTQNVANYVQRNRDIIAQANEYMGTVAKKTGKEFREIIPIDFHTFEVLDPDDLKKALNDDTFDAIKTGFVRRVSEEPINTGGLNLAQRMEIESDRLANIYMDKHERTAQKLLSIANNAVSENPTGAAVQKFFGAYDKLTSMIKNQHLTFSHNWVTNNYTENVVRAYLSGGAGNAYETLLNQSSAAVRNIDSALTRDLMMITDPAVAKKGIRFNNDLMHVALDYGAIEKGFFSDVLGKNGVTEEFLVAKKGTSAAREAIENASKRNPLSTLQDFMGSTVGRTGAMIEGASRYTTFKYHIDKILESPEILSKLGIQTDASVLKQAVESPEMRKQIITLPQIGDDLDKVFKSASDITGKIFFNYKNVSAFEQKVMKRVFPYWTFFSRNVPFWLEKAGEHPGAASAIMDIVKSTGAPLDDQDRTTIPDYMLKTLPRKLGDNKFVSVPNISVFDASNQLEDSSDTMAKVHPLLKLVNDFASGTDQYGAPLLPSNTSKGEKKATGTATKFEPFTNSLKRDNNDKLKVTNDATQIALQIQQALLPTGLIDTAANMISDKRLGKKDYTESFFNLGPVKTKEVLPIDRANTLKFRNSDRLKELHRKINYDKNQEDYDL